MHKKYCLVVTDDYSRFTWVFFLTTKDKTSDILKNFIKEIENLVDKKVKIIKSDNGTEFKNKVMDDFCREKGIRREYSVAKTPQQNGMAGRRNRTLIEAARTILGKFDGKSDEGFFVGYSLSSKAFRVYNTRTRRVEENLHIGFIENKPMIEGNGPKWLFGIDFLTQSMNYVPIAAGTITNESAGIQGELNVGLQVQQKEDGIFISQDKYVDEILKNSTTLIEVLLLFYLLTISILQDLEKPLVKDGDANDVDVHLYRSMIGSLMYLTTSRPNIMFVVCACARFQVTLKTSQLLRLKENF
ncbi:putative ribonuclease H-like domain-containing protein [Tanacetum coccineum]|uniref:Ribonuclease H-like domain-containing protein n=1 Tax=Tanacetum coccineum TaxID=301880 RepID=A0ABQ5HE97_9ASTR